MAIRSCGRSGKWRFGCAGLATELDAAVKKLGSKAAPARAEAVSARKRLRDFGFKVAPV